MRLVSDHDYARLQQLKRQDEVNAERFRLKSQCRLCGYQSMDIYPDQNCCCPMIDCEGGMGELR